MSFRKHRGWLAALLFATLTARLPAQTGQTVYTDSLLNGWGSYGWATLNYNNASPVHGGSFSISVTAAAYEALYLHHNAQNGSQFASLTFWINGGAGGQSVKVQATRNGAPQTEVFLSPLPVNSWRQETISLSSLGVSSAADFDGFWIQSQSGSSIPTFYVDDITLVTNSTPPATVVLTAPANGANYLGPATVNLAATVTTNGHVIDRVQFYNGGSLLNEDLTPPYSFSWTNVGAGNYSLFARVLYDQGTGSAGSSDSTAAGVVVVTNLSATVVVDAQKNRHPINPLIYGVAFATSNQLSELNATLNRSGGNTETRYNWQINSHNRGNDWYFESLVDAPGTPGAAADDHVAQSKNGGASAVLTVPMLGWVPKPGRLSSYSIAKYGAQTGNDWQWFADAGNGVSVTNSTPITWNDPNDANFPTNSAFQREWLRHLTNLWKLSTNGGVRYYCMDNEHTLWHSTHRDVHPVGTTMQEIRDKFFDYGAVVKGVDPNALLLAPEEWGWPGYFWSGYDQQIAPSLNWNQSLYPDRGTNGGWDYMPWFLDQARQYEVNTGQRLLDVFTLHVYPQSGEFGDDTSTSMQLKRNQTTRILWDTNYFDTSWIQSIVKLIPRMKAWVAAYYPGTKIGLTEYNWGAEGHINGATAQADIYGIFGRESLDYGTRWTTPGSSTPTFKAMKLYRNYDGNKSTFGDTSVSSAGPNPDLLSTFAAQRSSDGAMTVMAINKQLLANSVTTFSLSNYLSGGTAQVWQLTSANTIAHPGDVNFTGNTFSNTLPAQSVTLFVIAAGGPPVLRDPAMNSGTNFSFWLDGRAGLRYAIQSSDNFVNWTSVQTNTLVGNSLQITLTVTAPARYYRAQWLP